jgi:hypothetical protein
MLALFGLLQSPGLAAQYNCPEKIHVETGKNITQPDWLMHNAFPEAPVKEGDFKFRSSWIAFIDHPNRLISPDAEKKIDGLEIYQTILAPKTEFVVSCSYGGTHLVLYRQLPDKLSQCTHTISVTGKKQASNIVECQ